jgi:hypothetical protein
MLAPATASERAIFQDLPWNKITGFIPEMLGFEITINLSSDFIPTC